jgi:hypothetical protein
MIWIAILASLVALVHPWRKRWMAWLALLGAISLVFTSGHTGRFFEPFIYFYRS